MTSKMKGSATEHEMDFPEIDLLEDPYLCVGICQIDPDSGYCLGCGRPPLPIVDTADVSDADSESRKEAAATA